MLQTVMQTQNHNIVRTQQCTVS